MTTNDVQYDVTHKYVYFGNGIIFKHTSVQYVTMTDCNPFHKNFTIILTPWIVVWLMFLVVLINQRKLMKPPRNLN